MAGLATVRSPRRHTQQLRLGGKGYRVADEDQAKAAGGRRWQVSVLDTQEVDRTDEFHLPLEYFHEGGGYSFQGIPGTYDYCDGWDASTPTKLSTWPKLTTGQVFESADSRGWLLYVEPYLYAMRGRFVVKYRPSETSAEWAIIEKHDLGSGNLVAGRPAVFKGAGYVPIVDSSGALQRFHQLTTVATTVVESQTIAISGTPTGGTYTVTFDGKTTAAIAYNADAATVQAALRLVAGMELVTVSSTGSTPNFTHTVVMTGVAGAMAAASPPQMTSSSSLTGGTPAINHATTVAGTTDTWTQGPANREMRCFVAPWRDKMVGADDYEIRTVSADPMTANDWNPNTTDGISVGNTTSRITDLCVYDYLVLVGKEDGMYSFDEDLRPKNELPDLASIKDENNCLPGEAVVRIDGTERAVSRRWFQGSLVEIQTRSGHRLSGTPNHPVLTDRGWVGLGCLHKGDNVVRERGSGAPEPASPHVEDVHASLREVFDAACDVGVVVRRSGGGMPFHGDGQDSDVDVVAIDRQLLNRLKAAFPEHCHEFGFARENPGEVRLPANGLLRHLIVRGGRAAAGLIRGPRALLANLRADTRRAQLYGLPMTAGDSVLLHQALDGVGRDAVVRREIVGGSSVEVTLDEVVAIRRRPFSGHVYNLETETHRYTAEGIVTHNCVGMTVMGGIVHIPHRAGLVLWAPGTYEFAGPQQEGALEGELTPWGRVSSLTPFGKFAFFAANDAIAQKGIVGSLQPPRGQRAPRAPHYHHVTDAASIECVAVVSSDYLPNPAVTPATWSDDNAVGTVTWSNTGNATAADGSEASATAGTSHYLKGLNPNPVVPDSATITGVKARIKRRGGKVQFRAVGTPDFVRGTSVVVPNPASVQVGDLMFVALNLAGVPTVTAPAGWTLLTSQAVGANIKGYFYYKFKDSGDGASWTWTVSITSDVVYGLYAASGVSTTDPFGAAAGTAYTSGSGPYSGADSPTVTPDAARSLLICVVGIREGDTTADLTITAPSGMTDRLNHVECVASAAAARGLAVAELELSSGAATGAKSWTFGTDTAVDAFTFSVTLNPAGDGVDNVVKLVRAGSVVGDNKADTSTAWPVTAGYAEYGGQNDLWGTTLTAAQVNASDFGIVLSATVNVGTVYVDHIELVIYYTVSGVTEPASFLVALRVDTDRQTVTPDVYKLPRADLAIGNDPTIDRAVSAGADFYSSRLFYPSRNIEKVWRCFEFYADFDPQTNTPGLQVWAAVDNGTEVQLLDANGLAATIRTSGFHRLFFPATSASRGKWVQLHIKIPAASGSENGVAVDMRGWALRGWYQPTRSEEVVTVVDLTPGERGDYSGERRSGFDALDELIALSEPGANPTSYRDIWGREGYCRVLEVRPHEVAFKDGQEPGVFASVRMRVALYEN